MPLAASLHSSGSIANELNPRSPQHPIRAVSTIRRPWPAAGWRKSNSPRTPSPVGSKCCSEWSSVVEWWRDADESVRCGTQWWSFRKDDVW